MIVTSRYRRLRNLLFDMLLPKGRYSVAPYNTYYVSTTGSDSNRGNVNLPFATVEKAVSVAKPGDTIYVRGGTYELASPTVNGLTIDATGLRGN